MVALGLWVLIPSSGFFTSRHSGPYCFSKLASDQLVSLLPEKNKRKGYFSIVTSLFSMYTIEIHIYFLFFSYWTMTPLVWCSTEINNLYTNISCTYLIDIISMSIKIPSKQPKHIQNNPTFRYIHIYFINRCFLKKKLT